MQKSRPIDQAVSSDFIKQDKFKELFSDQLLHQDTRDYIKKVVLETMGHEDGIAKIKKYAKESAKEYAEETGLEKKKFWIPNWIAIALVLVTIVSIIVAYYKKG